MEMRASGSGSGRKPSQGRKKIEIKKIEKQSSRQVTFSKRRVGLFKKASELCILSGASVAIVIQSSGKRVFSFGHPDVDAVIDRYLRAAAAGEEVEEFPAAVVVPNMAEYNKHHADVSKELDLEKRRSVSGGGAGGAEWWLDDFEGKGLEDLEQYVAALDELSNNVREKADGYMVLQNNNSFLPPLPPSLTAVHNPHMEAAPPLSLDDTAGFVNQNFHNQVWGGYHFGQGHI